MSIFYDELTPLYHLIFQDWDARTPPKKMALDFCSTKFRRKRFWICGRLIFFGQFHWKIERLLTIDKHGE
jgi:hypothetical protein